MQQAIAILDSGVGGLTVAKEIIRQLPREKVIYFGDTARSPYGPRSAEEVRLFTQQIVDYLIQFNPKLIVIACNTATAAAIDHIRASVSVPVLGVIAPGARAAIQTTRTGVVGVIGTEGTIRSQAYEQALASISPGIQVHSAACPLLAPLVEKGLFRTREAAEVVEQSLRPLLGIPMDCLILGCTHYPFLAPAISRIMGPNVTLISSAEETAREVSGILAQRGMRAAEGAAPVHHLFCSGEPKLFQQIAWAWLRDQLTAAPVIWQVPSFK